MVSHNKPIDSQDWINRINDSDEYIKDMMSFYTNGWINRGEEDNKKIKDRIKANIVLTFTYVDEIINELAKMNLAANCVYLKMNSFINQTVLISVPIERYLDDEFPKIYAVASKIEKSSKSENYSVRFNFTFDDGNIDEENLKADGFHKTIHIR